MTLGGFASGWISGALVSELGDTYNAVIWIPGACFALWTLAVAWGPIGLTTRARVKRNPAWNFGIGIGVTLSYVAAYYVAYWTVLSLPNQAVGIPLEGVRQLIIGGIAGGAVGSAALVNLWSLLFPALGDLRTRSVLITWGSLLGAALSLSQADYLLANWKPSPFLFVTWQGGMALALGFADHFAGKNSDSPMPGSR